MARIAQVLSKAKIAQLKDPGFYAVGGVAGLHLKISETGAKSWILRVMVASKRRDLGLGSFADVTVEEAREAARQQRLKIKDGADPVADKQATRAAAIAARASATTFQEAAAKYIAANEAGWKSTKHAAQWGATLETYAFPVFGQMDVKGIETNHVLTVLEPIWATKTETASRVRGRIESVLDWAKVRGFRSGENPARWKGHLDHILPPPKKVAKVKHHAALPYQEVGAFMAALRSSEGMGAWALEFAILTACRSGEVRGATWSEIDEKAGVWIIPATRMKAGKEHRVPLSPAAMKLIKALPKMAGTDLVFPNAQNKQLSDMTLTAVIKRMHESSTKAGGNGWKDSTGEVITAHGFRSTFRDWAGECTNHPREVVEHALAHQLKDKAEAAYARTDLLAKRLKLMSDWANVCAKTAPATVTPLAIVTADSEQVAA